MGKSKVVPKIRIRNSDTGLSPVLAFDHRRDAGLTIKSPHAARGNYLRGPAACLGILLVLGAVVPRGAARDHDGLHEGLPSSERLLFQREPCRAAHLIPEAAEAELPISTSSERARAFFNQGLAFFYANWPREAERAFHTAHLADPAAPMPQWGVALCRLLLEPRGAVYWIEKTRRAAEEAGALSKTERALFDALPRAETVEKGGDWQEEMENNLDSAGGENADVAAVLARLLSDAWYHRLGDFKKDPDDVLEMIARVAASRPDHPVSRSGLHLWAHGRRHDAYRTPKAYFDLSTLALSPVFASDWNLVSRYLADRGNLRDAFMQGEVAARIHHRWAAQRRILPDQLPGYARHRAAQVRQLTHLGNAEAAITLAHELLRIPRHPAWNSPANRFGSAHEGRKALIDCYTFFGLWDELDAALRDGRIEALEAPRSRAEHAFAQAIAAWFRDDAAIFHFAADRLEGIAVESAAAFRDRPVEAGPVPASDLHHGGLARWLRDGGDDYLSVKEWNDAVKALRLHMAGNSGGAGQVIAGCHRIPWLLRARLLWDAGSHRLARQALLNAPRIPMEMRVEACARPSSGPFPLQPGTAFSQKSNSRIPGALRGLGMTAWEPQPLPKIAVPLADGTRLTNDRFKGKHTALILYYGSDCTHCVEQLVEFHRARRELEAAEIAVYAIAPQPIDALADWLAEPGRVPFPAAFGSDPEEETFHALGAYDDFIDMPHHALIYVDPRGVALWQDIGDAPFMDVEFFIEETVRLRELYPGEKSGPEFAQSGPRAPREVPAEE